MQMPFAQVTEYHTGEPAFFDPDRVVSIADADLFQPRHVDFDGPVSMITLVKEGVKIEIHARGKPSDIAESIVWVIRPGC